MVKQIEYKILSNELEKGIKHVSQSLVPGWNESEDISFIEVKGGVTNKLYQVSASDQKEKILVRIYGNQTEALIDRDAELKNLVVIYKNGFAPKFYGYFDNGFVYGFFEGRDLSPEDLCEGKMAKQIAIKLSNWHKQEIPSADHNPSLWPKLEGWFKLIPKEYKDPEKQSKFSKLDIAKIKAEMEFLRGELKKFSSPVVFCHNDLLSKNIIWDESKGEVHFIDYEYGAYNYRAFDLANHFCEFAGFEADYSKYPTKEQQYVYFREYLRVANEREPTEKELKDFYREVNAFALSCHFFWGTWSLVQASISDIQFDFLEYAILRFGEYFNKKDQFLSL